MSRSIAAAPGRRRAAGSRLRGAPGSRPRGAAPKSSPRALGAVRPFTAAAGFARTATTFVLHRRRLRIALLAGLVALPLAGCTWMWLRQSPFVAVQHVQITGVHGADAHEVESALTQAAHGMSTLDVSDGALAAAVAPLRVVRAVRAIPSFPHGLRIVVSEQLPVAALSVGGVRTAVAADGVVLGPALLSGSLPSVSGWSVPAPGRHVSGASLLAALTVLGAAPAPFAKHIERVFTGAKGLTVAMRNGLLVYFGDADRPLAKWLSLARVLADQSSAGASYVDVRLPSHPAAGFPAGMTPPDASATTGAGSSEQLDSTESTIAALAAGLAGGSGTTSTTGTEPAASSPSGAASTSPQESEVSTAGPETGTASEAEASQTAPATGG
jgi:cell division protein FtsQ